MARQAEKEGTRASGAGTDEGKKPHWPLWRQMVDRVLWVVLAVIIYALLEYLMPAWPCLYQHWGPSVERTNRHMDRLGGLAYGFRVSRGRYPVSLEELADFPPSKAYPMAFRDGWSREFIYARPGKVNTHAFDLYSSGANGLDDGGRGDDLTNWREPEPLYYGRDHYRGWLNSTIFDVTVALALGWIGWTLVRWRGVFYPVLRGGRPKIARATVPVWLGPALLAIVAAAVFLYHPRVKTEYYYWRWSSRLARRNFLFGDGGHTNVEDAATVLVYMGPLASPVVAEKLTQRGTEGKLDRPKRERTVRLLGLMGDPSVIPVLREFLLRPLEDPLYVRHFIVAHALRRLGDRSVVWILMDDLTEGHFMTSLWSAKGLELLTWHCFGDLTPMLPPEGIQQRIDLWGQWWRENQNRSESEWLRDGVEQALAQLTSDDPSLRVSALRRLRRMTGMNFYYDPFMMLSSRLAAARVWRSWWREHRYRFRHVGFDQIDRRFRTVEDLELLEW